MNPKRLFLALGGDAANSIVSLLVTLIIAQVADLGGFADYSMSILVYGAALGMLHQVYADTAISREMSRPREQYFASAALTPAVVLGALITVWAIFTRDWFLFAVGCGLPGVTLYDYYRTLFRVRGEAANAFLMPVAVLASVGFLSYFSLARTLTPIVLFSGWFAVTSGIGIAMHLRRSRQRVPIRDRHIFREELSLSWWFAVDFLAGSGGAQVAVLLIGIIVSPTLPAALRAAGTLVGPLNVLSTTLRSLMIGHLSESVARGGTQLEWRNAKRVGGLSLFVWTALGGLTFVLAQSFGGLLLGEAWSLGSQVLVFVLVESWLAFLANVPAAGLRHRFAGRSSATLRILLGMVRPVIFLWSSLTHGLMGLAWSLVGFALISVLAWWVLYRRTLARR